MKDRDWLSRKLILFSGKGGVGKTTLAEATARSLAAQGKSVLLCHVLQVSDEHEQRLEKVAPNLSTITLRAADCFREYIIMKLKVKALYTAFLSNKITQYLEKAAPGIREIVLLGKVWFERHNFDHVVVDMPSTGYALTMIHTPFNFAALFPGGPVYRDAKDMIETFSDPEQTALVTVTLAEEMPVQESLELAANLKELMPGNPSHLVINRLIRVDEAARKLHHSSWAKLTKEQQANPLWQGLDYLVNREIKQNETMAELKKSWRTYSKDWLEIEEIAAKEDTGRSTAIAGLISRNRTATL